MCHQQAHPTQVAYLNFNYLSAPWACSLFSFKAAVNPLKPCPTTLRTCPPCFWLRGLDFLERTCLGWRNHRRAVAGLQRTRFWGWRDLSGWDWPDKQHVWCHKWLWGGRCIFTRRFDRLDARAMQSEIWTCSFGRGQWQSSGRQPAPSIPGRFPELCWSSRRRWTQWKICPAVKGALQGISTSLMMRRPHESNMAV